jgi:shikimate kinase
MQMKKPIFLVGMMGAGKSSLGKALAQGLNLPFLDSDEWIEAKSQKTITELFEKDGESVFRLWEKQFLDALNGESLIIATGGGLPCFHGNMDRLKELGTVLYLKLTVEQLVKRVSNDGERPLLTDVPDIQSKINDLLELRAEIYEQAHFILNGDASIPKLIEQTERLMVTNKGLF